jgi:peroxiredoxin
MAEQTPICDFGWQAPAFRLLATDGKTYTLDELRGPKGTLIVFICNHCPYVQAILDRLIRDAKDLAALGVATVAISSNDVSTYPEDSFERMAEVAAAHGFPFPYLYDESQDVARRFGAVCTPDFFGFDADLGLQYRGRLDASGKNPAPRGARRDLFEAMQAVVATGRGPEDQVPSVGCSIKWKTA